MLPVSGQIGKIGEKRPRSPDIDSMTSGVTTSPSDSDLTSLKDNAKVQQLFHLLKGYKKLCLEALINIKNLTSSKHAEMSYQLMQILSQLRLDMDFAEFSKMTIKEVPPETIPGQEPPPRLPPLSVVNLLETDDELALFFWTTDLRRFFNEQDVLQKCLTTPAAYDTLFDCLQQLFSLGHQYHLLTLFKFIPDRTNLPLTRLVEHPAIVTQFSVAMLNSLQPAHQGEQLMQWLVEKPNSHRFILHLVMQHPEPVTMLTLLNETDQHGACLRQRFAEHPHTAILFAQWLQHVNGVFEPCLTTPPNMAKSFLAKDRPCEPASQLGSLTAVCSSPHQELMAMDAQEPSSTQKSYS